MPLQDFFCQNQMDFRVIERVSQMTLVDFRYLEEFEDDPQSQK